MNGNESNRGTSSSQTQHSSLPSKPVRNYKLLSDPFITKGAPKIYRYDGIVPNEPNHPVVIPRDPRPRSTTNRIRNKYDQMDFPVPRYN
jgi:histone-lysine N-methyltransferase SETD1